MSCGLLVDDGAGVKVGWGCGVWSGVVVGVGDESEVRWGRWVGRGMPVGLKIRFPRLK